MHVSQASNSAFRELLRDGMGREWCSRLWMCAFVSRRFGAYRSSLAAFVRWCLSASAILRGFAVIISLMFLGFPGLRGEVFLFSF